MGAERCGSLFQYTIFWDLSYGTTDPNVVKVRILPATPIRFNVITLRGPNQTILATDFANYEKGMGTLRRPIIS